MYTIDATFKGLADMLFNRMPDEEMANFRSGKSSGDMSDEQRAKLAEKRAYADDAGLYWPQWTVKKTILEGASAAGLKFNRKPLRQRLAAVLFVREPGRFVTENGKMVAERDYLHQVPGRQPPGPKGKMAIIRRPALKAGWLLRVRLVVVDDAVPPEAVRQATEQAGMLVGTGAWRPEYGRFVVTEWSVSKENGGDEPKPKRSGTKR